MKSSCLFHSYDQSLLFYLFIFFSIWLPYSMLYCSILLLPVKGICLQVQNCPNEEWVKNVPLHSTEVVKKIKIKIKNWLAELIIFIINIIIIQGQRQINIACAFWSIALDMSDGNVNSMTNKKSNLPKPFYWGLLSHFLGHVRKSKGLNWELETHLMNKFSWDVATSCCGW